MLIVIFGSPGLDTGVKEIDTETGEIIEQPGNRGGGPWGYDDVKRAVAIMKHAAEIKDHELRKATIRAASEYLVEHRILSPGGNIVLAMDDQHGPEPVLKPPVGTGLGPQPGGL
jgi:hypothetical protein